MTPRTPDPTNPPPDVAFEALLEEGRYEEALRLVSGLGGETIVTEAVLRVMALAAETGDGEHCLSLARMVQQEEDRAEALRAVLAMHLQKHDEQKALPIAWEIRAIQRNSNAVHEVILCYIRLGDLDSAWKMAKELSEESFRSRTWTLIGETLAKSGDFEQAKIAYTEAFELPDYVRGYQPSFLLPTLESIADCLPTPHALELAEGMQEEYEKHHLFLLIADQLKGDPMPP